MENLRRCDGFKMICKELYVCFKCQLKYAKDPKHVFVFSTTEQLDIVTAVELIQSQVEL